MKTIYITIKIEYDPEKFPEGDMHWAAEKISECDPIHNIGYDRESYETTSEVTHHE